MHGFVAFPVKTTLGSYHEQPRAGLWIHKQCASLRSHWSQQECVFDRLQTRFPFSMFFPYLFPPFPVLNLHDHEELLFCTSAVGPWRQLRSAGDQVTQAPQIALDVMGGGSRSWSYYYHSSMVPCPSAAENNSQLHLEYSLKGI